MKILVLGDIHGHDSWKEAIKRESPDKVVNSILFMCEKNGGKCPCHNTGEDTNCPCSDYREKDLYHCGLYLKLK